LTDALDAPRAETQSDSRKRARWSKSRRNVVASRSRCMFKNAREEPQRLRGTMNAEIDYDLTPDQWEALKALRVPSPKSRGFNRLVVEELMALGLAAMRGDAPAITPRGLKD